MTQRQSFLLKLFVSAVLIAFLFAGSRTLLSQVLEQFRSASVAGLIIAVCIMFASNLLGAAQWQIFLRQAHLRLPFLRVVSYYFTGLFFNNFLLSNVGGDAVRIFDVARHEKQRTSRVLATIVVDRVFGLICLISAGSVAAFVYFLRTPKPDMLIVSAYGLLIAGVGVMVLFFFSIRIRYLFFLMARKLPFASLRKAILHFLHSLNCYGKHPGVFLRALGMGLPNQIVKVLVAWLTAISLGGEGLALLHFFLCIPLLGIVKVVPISIMGLGPHEIAGRRLFSSVGIAAKVSVSFLLMFQVVVMIANLLSGVFFLFREPINRYLVAQQEGRP